MRRLRAPLSRWRETLHRIGSVNELDDDGGGDRDLGSSRHRSEFVVANGKEWRTVWAT